MKLKEVTEFVYLGLCLDPTLSMAEAVLEIKSKAGQAHALVSAVSYSLRYDKRRWNPITANSAFGTTPLPSLSPISPTRKLVMPQTMHVPALSHDARARHSRADLRIEFASCTADTAACSFANFESDTYIPSSVSVPLSRHS